MPFQRSKP